jgi:hypothetical protein
LCKKLCVNENKTVSINQVRLTDGQYQHALSIIATTDVNGYTPEQRAEVERQESERLKQLMEHPVPEE